MAKKNTNAIYAPGELDRVRGNLGKIDENEAKRVADILGGEVGTERAPEPEQPARGKTVGSGRRSGKPAAKSILPILMMKRRRF